ncbi:MAG: YidC/Oxa1 family membrane protein insertase, partial [Christensenellales bacterium]
MDFISIMLAPLQWPASGVWETIIKWLSGVGNIAVAIILLTLILKLLLLPVDFWQRSVTRKMSLKQAEMQPELEKIKQKYGNSELGQQKTAELYKKHGMSPTSSCGVMLVYMVLTLLVFITLFNGLGSISRTQINYEYYQLQTEYSVVYKQSLAETDYDTSIYDSVEAYAKATAQNAVATKYDEVRQGFLWIKNIWRPDNWSSVFPTADEFLSTTGSKFYIETNAESDFYNMVMLSTDTSVPYVDVNLNVYAIPSADPSTDPSTILIEGYPEP